MKKIKLYFLIAAALFTGSAMATSYIPLGVKDVTENTIVYAADVPMGNAYTPASSWIGCPTTNVINESKAYTNVTNDATGGNPKGLTDNLPTTVENVTMSKLATGANVYNSAKKVVHMHVKGISEIIVHGITGSGDRGMAIGCNEYTSSLTEASEIPTSASVQFANKTKGSFIVNLDNLDSSKEYIISIWAVGGDAYFYAAELIAGAACKDAGLSLAENPDIEVNEGETLVVPALTNEHNVAVTYSSSDESVVTVAEDGTLTKVGAGDAVITITSASQTVNGVLYCADELTYNVKIKSLSPVLEATKSALDFSLNAFETTKSATFTVSGYNLSGVASVSTLPDGFTLYPAELTLTDGAVEQVYTLTYAPEAAVEASNANLVFSVGTTSVTIALTYGKKAALTQTVVTADINWVWTNAGTEDVLFTETSIPSKTDTIVLANVEGIVNDANFNSQALSVCGEYMYRKEFNCFQGGYISFEVEKAGSVTVSYSHTSKAKPKRSLVVNGQKDAASTADYTPVTSTMSVNAGKVVITFVETDDANNAPQYARVYSVSYTVDNSGDVGSAVEQAQVEAKAVKVIRDGQLLIIRDGKTYTAQGMELR